MLSRVADAIYWLSRYVERAENVARFVDVNQSFTLGGAPQWAPLIYASGDQVLFHDIFNGFTPENVLRFLLFSDRNPNSIVSCLVKARENARTIRDIISVSMWEAVNRFYLRARDAAREPDRVIHNPADFLERVKRASHAFIGVSEATLSHGQAWNFAEMGRLLERADKTTRVLDVKYFSLAPAAAPAGSPLDVVQWSALLESTSALHMYRNRFGRITPSAVAEFLLLDPLFPRSARFCVAHAEASFHALPASIPAASREPVEEAFRRLRGRLEAATPADLAPASLHAFIDDCQIGLNEIGDAIYRNFFVARPSVAAQTQRG